MLGLFMQWFLWAPSFVWALKFLNGFFYWEWAVLNYIFGSFQTVHSSSLVWWSELQFMMMPTYFYLGSNNKNSPKQTELFFHLAKVCNDGSTEELLLQASKFDKLFVLGAHWLTSRHKVEGGGRPRCQILFFQSGSFLLLVQFRKDAQFFTK